MSTIDQIQKAIIEEFTSLGDDPTSKLQYLMEIGESLPPMDGALKKEENILEGCISTVWLAGEIKGNKLYLQADSNTAITKGLISLLIRIFSGQEKDNILHTSLYCLQEIGLYSLIGFQRNSGLAKMIEKIKSLAQKDSVE